MRRSISETIILLFVAGTFFSMRVSSQTEGRSPHAIDRSRGPELTYKPQLEFPDLALHAGLEATITIKFALRKDGRPYKIEIVKREPEFAFVFDEHVRRWAMKCEFTPALDERGDSVSVWVSFPVRFRIAGFRPPTIIEQPLPEYPTDAQEMGLEGWVGFAVLIDAYGRRQGDPVVVYRYPEMMRVFDDAAIEVVRKTRFRSAKTNGENSNGWIFMKVEFALSPNQG